MYRRARVWTNSRHRGATSSCATDLQSPVGHTFGTAARSWGEVRFAFCEFLCFVIWGRVLEAMVQMFHDFGMHCVLNSDSLCGRSRKRKKCVWAAPACTDRICALRGTAQCQSCVAGVFWVFSRPILWLVCSYFWCLCMAMFGMLLASFGHLGGISGIFLTFRVPHFTDNFFWSLWTGLGRC